MTDEMTCAAMEEKIPLLVYNELPSDELPMVQSHLAACDACKASFDELSESASFLDESTTSMPPLTLSDEERSNILTSILEGATDVPERKETKPAHTKKPAAMTPAMWAILLVAILVLAAILYHFFGN